jgi:hypothetical protein
MIEISLADAFIRPGSDHPGVQCARHDTATLPRLAINKDFGRGEVRPRHAKLADRVDLGGQARRPLTNSPRTLIRRIWQNLHCVTEALVLEGIAASIGRTGDA